jgi:lipopolysaccharide biosynthesis regulator YciM
MAFQSLENQPRSRATQKFLEDERAHAWDKALYVADRLKTLRPDEHNNIEQFAATFFNCTLAMGGNLAEAVAVVNEINSQAIEDSDPA